MTLLVAACICCAACGAPSLRHKQEVNKLLAAGEFGAAAQKLESVRTKQYSRRDRVLYQLDSGAVLQDGGQYDQSDERFSAAQERIDELFTRSVSAYSARFFINDLTAPYQPAIYEQMLTYYYRAMNFLARGDLQGALVEANRAVFYLDHLSDKNAAHWQNDAFVQYFMSLVFESAGKRDDARIARSRAAQSNGAAVDALKMQALPDGWGEVVIVHANGVVPLKKSQTFQIAWDRIWLWMNDAAEGESNVSPEVQNAISSGLMGHSITLSYPVLETQNYRIASSEAVTAQGQVYPTQLLGNVADAVETDLKEKQAGYFVRMATRAAAKRVMAVQARHATEKASKDESLGNLAELFVGILGAATEKADTRQWFTLPAQFRLTRFYVPAGQQDITLRFKDGNGKIVGEHTFEKVPVQPGGRVYLHYRTAK
ncbi:MAG: hypothetical protein J6U96_00155 [Elusimicrobiaceae bacterium]|nr:hypothetical protein [Elusimicrobiaceae bacterium]